MESQSTATAMRERFGCCFRNWIAQQHCDLDELLRAVSTDSGDTETLKSLARQNIQHFRDYLEARSELAQHDAPSFFCPSWCTSFGNSFHWIGCSRPTLAIRLVYSVSGSELEARLAGRGRRGDDDNSNSGSSNLGEISAPQLKSINELHIKMVRMEEKLSSRMASTQEETADDPLALIAKRSGRVGEESEREERVMKGRARAVAGAGADGGGRAEAGDAEGAGGGDTDAVAGGVPGEHEETSTLDPGVGETEGLCSREGLSRILSRAACTRTRDCCT